MSGSGPVFAVRRTVLLHGHRDVLASRDPLTRVHRAEASMGRVPVPLGGGDVFHLPEDWQHRRWLDGSPGTLLTLTKPGWRRISGFASEVRQGSVLKRAVQRYADDFAEDYLREQRVLLDELARLLEPGAPAGAPLRTSEGVKDGEAEALEVIEKAPAAISSHQQPSVAMEVAEQGPDASQMATWQETAVALMSSPRQTKGWRWNTTCHPTTPMRRS
eukprot:Skav207172  [mRNA]  locus=scaffold573:676198:683671:- [translate_table: standard]